MKLYHGSIQIVEKPEIRISRFNKDFYFGFYCTSIEQQAIRWATRFGSGYINVYDYAENSDLKILRFEKMTDEWLDFIVACRNGKAHDYDIVEGPMADDTIFNYVQSFIDGQITREAFWNLAKFKYPTHQICFNTEKALATLTFNSARAVHE
jgi:hypothetical protein